MRCVDDAERLRDRGHNVTSVTRCDTPLEERFAAKGFSPFTVAARDYLSPIASIRLARLFRNRGLTALHMHRTQDVGTALLAADLGGVPNRVLTLRMESEQRKFDPYHRWVYGRLTRVLTITERLRRLVIENRPIAAGKVHCLYNGTDFARLRASAEDRTVIRERWGIPGDSFVVGMVGRIDPLKGQRSLITAISGLTKTIPLLRLMIVGEESVGETGERRVLEHLIAEQGLQETVIFTGHQHPPGITVPAFDVAVMPSRKETFGNVAVEASGLGVPVIATDAGGAPEIITHGRNGLLVPPDDSNALMESLRKLYFNPEMRFDMGKEGAIMAEQRFSIEKHLAGLEKALEG